MMGMFQIVFGIGVSLTLAALIIKYVWIPEWNYNMGLRRAFRIARKHKVDSEVFGVPPQPCWWQLKDLREGGEYASRYSWWYVKSTSAAAAKAAVIRYMNENLCASGPFKAQITKITGCLTEGIVLSGKMPNINVIFDDGMEA